MWSSLSAAMAAPLGPARPLHEQRAELGVASRVVADLADMQQPACVVDHGGRQRRPGRGRSVGRIRRGQTAVHAHERHGVVLLPGHVFPSASD